MLDNYKIIDNILYIELNFDYEFGSSNKIIKNDLKELLSKLNLKNNIKKIVITCGGFIIGTILFLNNNKNISNNNIRYIPNFDNEIVLNINNDKNNNLASNDVSLSNENSNTEVNNEIPNNTITTTNENISDNNYQTNISNTNDYVETNITNEIMVTIYRSNGEIITISLEEYIIGVIGAEMPASFNNEALKAQAVASRTYALKAIDIGKTLTDTVSTQSYINENEMRDKWGSSFDYYYNKIKDAVYSTKGEYLTYNGYYIEALYHSTNNGKTESSSDVFGNYYPYLISVSSEFDKNASSYLRTTSMDINNVSSRLGIDLNNNSIIEILSYTDGNNIREININGKTFTGKNVRELLGLRSADFDINIIDNIVNITTRGFGHGVGLSQYGANGMANAGYSYKDILYHYYPGTYISN